MTACEGTKDDLWWKHHWSVLDEAAKTDLALILLTHGPPLHRLDGIKAGRQAVGDRNLMWQLQSMSHPPVLHVFGHVHAKQFLEETDVGPRLMSDRVNGILFLNCAAERKLPSISSAALAGQMARATQNQNSGEATRKKQRTNPSSIERCSQADFFDYDHTNKNKSGDDDGTEEEGEGDPRDAKIWLRPPALLRVPLTGRVCSRSKDFSKSGSW